MALERNICPAFAWNEKRTSSLTAKKKGVIFSVMGNRLETYDMVDHEIPDKNTLFIIRDGQAYLFRFDDAKESRAALFQVFHQFANDPDLDFAEADQILLARKVEERFPASDCSEAA